MAEELYFFKFNKDIAKVKLPPLLKEESEFSYRQHITANKARYGAATLEILLDKIENDIELLTIDELWSLYDWFYEKGIRSNSNWEHSQVKAEMLNYGLDLFYEFLSKTSVGKFQSILADYERLFNKDVDCKCTAEELSGFLNYAICYAGELSLFLNKYYYSRDNDSEESLEVRQIIRDISIKTDSYYHRLALLEIERNKEANFETMSLIPKLVAFRQATRDQVTVTYPLEFNEILEREDDIVNLAAIFFVVIEIKEKIKDYHGMCMRLHSF